MTPTLKTMGVSILVLGAALAGGCSNGETTETASEAVEPMAVAAVEPAEAPAEEDVAEVAEVVEDVAEESASAVEAVIDDAEEAVEMVMADASEAVAGGASAVVAAVAQEAGIGDGGDAAKGKRIFTRCMSCHAVKEGQNKVGPSLYGIVGREAGTVEGFRYSDANANSGITWTKDVMFEYLEDPRGYLPGTKMIFPGLPKEGDRKDVIAYLESVVEE